MHNKGLRKNMTLKELHDAVFSRNSMMVQLRFCGMEYLRMGKEWDDDYLCGFSRGKEYEYQPLFVKDKNDFERCFTPFWDIGEKHVIEAGIQTTISTVRLNNGEYNKHIMATCDGHRGWVNVSISFTPEEERIYSLAGVDKLLRLFAVTIFFRGEV